MEGLMWLFLFSIYTAVIYSLTKKTYAFLAGRSRWLTLNFKQEPVVHSFGLQFVLHFLFFCLGVELWTTWVTLDLWRPEDAWRVAVLMLGLTAVGWMDDQYGTKATKGLRGHILALLKDKKVTTGLLKAIFGLMIAMAVSSIFSSNLWAWVWHTGVIVLSIHVLNLMDVRPGRALKSFWLFSLGLLPLLAWGLLFSVYLPFLLSTLVLFHYDRCRLAMLGDTGSLVLGGMLGYAVIHTGYGPLTLLYLVILSGLTILAEKVSFTALIKNTPWLAKLDHWGVR